MTGVERRGIKLNCPNAVPVLSVHTHTHTCTSTCISILYTAQVEEIGAPALAARYQGQLVSGLWFAKNKVS